MDLRVSPPVTMTGFGHGQMSASSPASTASSTTTMPSSRILLDIPCKVCQDHSSGKHYGIFACDGCAGFFKRSIRRNRQYVCKAKEEGKCLVDKTHRNQCRACRLVKCIESGMNKEAVQHERGPRNSTIRRQMSLLLKDGMDMAAAASGGYGHQQTALPPMHHSHAAGPPPALLHHFASAQAAAAALQQLDRHQQQPAGFPHNGHRMPMHPVFPGFPAISSPLNLTTATPVMTTPTMNGAGRVAFPGAPMPPPASLLAAMAAGSPMFHHGMAPPPSSPPQQQPSSPFMYTPSPKFPVPKMERTTPPPPAPQPQQPSVFMSPLSTVPNGTTSAPLLRDVELICESAARLLFLNVQWSKSLPAFTGLPAKDQQLLLEESWRELFILSAAQFLLPFEMAPLMANAGLTADSVVAAATAAAAAAKTDSQPLRLDNNSNRCSSVSPSPPPSPASCSDGPVKRESEEGDQPPAKKIRTEHPKKAIARSFVAAESSSSESTCCSSAESGDDEGDCDRKPPSTNQGSKASPVEPDVLTTLNEIRILRDILDQFKQMHVDPTEYACLKAIVLFKTVLSSATPKEASTVASLQDQAQLTLCKYIGAAYPAQPFRFGKLLLMLPTLRTVSSHTISKLFFQKTIGATPIEKLVSDMYRTHEF